MDHSALREALAVVVDPIYVLAYKESRTFFSTDVFRQANALALVGVQLGIVEKLQALVRACARHKARWSCVAAAPRTPTESCPPNPARCCSRCPGWKTAKLGVVAKKFGLNPRQQKLALTEVESSDPVDAALTAFRSARNPIDGALQVAKLRLLGRNFLTNAAEIGQSLIG